MRRMKSFLLIAMIPAMLAVTPRLHAQHVIPGRFGAGIFGGATLPRGDFKVVAGPGWHGGGLLKVDVVRWFDLRVDGTYTSFAGKEIPVTNPVAVIRTSSNMAFGTLSGVANMGADSAAYPGDNAVSPYLVAGVGLYRFRFDDTCTGDCEGFTATGKATNWGINFGFGATVPLAGFRTFVEGRYHSVRVNAIERGRSIFAISAGIKTK